LLQRETVRLNGSENCVQIGAGYCDVYVSSESSS
jgi:hypothetical protein